MTASEPVSKSSAEHYRTPSASATMHHVPATERRHTPTTAPCGGPTIALGRVSIAMPLDKPGLIETGFRIQIDYDVRCWMCSYLACRRTGRLLMVRHCEVTEVLFVGSTDCL